MNNRLQDFIGLAIFRAINNNLPNSLLINSRETRNREKIFKVAGDLHRKKQVDKIAKTCFVFSLAFYLHLNTRSHA